MKIAKSLPGEKNAGSGRLINEQKIGTNWVPSF